ncbi:MAG: SCO family protein [Hoeflea sp. D1-CHI-28]
MTRRLLFRALINFAIGGAALAAALGGIHLYRERSPQVAGTGSADKTFAEPGSVPVGGPFTLVDHTGQTVTEADYRGKYLLVFFGFTYCPDVCPTTLAEMARTMDLLGEDAKAVQPLFISVDPERDKPETMAEYVKAFHPSIVGLTGTPEQIAEVAEEYRTAYEKQPIEGRDGYTMAHQANTYLMSPSSEYLTHFSYGTKPAEMAETIRKAIARFGNPTAEKNDAAIRSRQSSPLSFWGWRRGPSVRRVRPVLRLGSLGHGSASGPQGRPQPTRRSSITVAQRRAWPASRALSRDAPRRTGRSGHMHGAGGDPRSSDGWACGARMRGTSLHAD